MKHNTQYIIVVFIFQLLKKYKCWFFIFYFWVHKLWKALIVNDEVFKKFITWISREGSLGNCGKFIVYCRDKGSKLVIAILAIAFFRWQKAISSKCEVWDYECCSRHHLYKCKKRKEEWHFLLCEHLSNALDVHRPLIV